MAIILHYTKAANGGFEHTSHQGMPMEFVIENIPDGVPVRIYLGEIGEDNNVTDDIEALKDRSAVYHIIEGAGGGVINQAVNLVGFILRPIAKLLTPKTPGVSASFNNNQAESPNNSLADRTNKPRPYERSYDICGTVQTIPNNLMTSYKKFTPSGAVIEYGYYDAGRGRLHIEPDGVTEGDTRIADISGSSVAIYAPFTSPNNTGTPQLQIGESINEKLYITYSSNDVDGQVLKAPNDLNIDVSGMTAYRNGNSGSIVGGDAGFSDHLSAGDIVILKGVRLDGYGTSGYGGNLSGTFSIISVSESTLTIDVSGSLGSGSWWSAVTVDGKAISNQWEHIVYPQDAVKATWTDWAYISRGEVKQVMANVAAANGMYKDNGTKQKASVTVEMQYQMTDNQKNPIGDILSQQSTIAGKSADYTGVSIVGELPAASRVRVRVRRVSDTDTGYNGTVSDEVTYINLYGQTADDTAHYGDRTTVHSARKQTPRAAEISEPQLRMIATEMVYKYLGNGIFDTELTPNTQAVQSLIRLSRDPVVGNLTMSSSSMDKLLAVQSEIEAYFGNAHAGQFCYTFDAYKTTIQEIAQTIAEAIFCNAYRRGGDIFFKFDKPSSGPSMVFTHRSKTPSGEKWTRTFNDASTYDSLEFSYIDPDTNVKETIRIPEDGGVNTEQYESKGIRNYQQAYWAANRRHLQNTLRKVAVEFNATEEGQFATPGSVISVVKGSRMAPFDGYVIAVNGLTLTLSQPVEFTDGDDHSIILKKRDGGVQSVGVVAGSNHRQVVMLSAPQEAIYTGNDALKTEFSFGNEQRHNGQMIVCSTVEPSNDRTVKISGFNYANFYQFDKTDPLGSGFDNGFSNGFY